MPVVNDATVINQSFDTSGNGGRKLVRLSNGWLVTAIKSLPTPSSHKAYYSKNDGVTWFQLFNTGNGVTDISLVAKDNSIYILNTETVSGGSLIRWIDIPSFVNSSYVGTVLNYNDENALSVNGTVVLRDKKIDTSQTALGNVSLAINEAGTELHATWSSKNSAYPNSFNIRYAKGTINANGSVAWGVTEQLTMGNTSGMDNNNPTILVKSDGNPNIILDKKDSGGCYIQSLNWNGTAWTLNLIYSVSTSYAQTFPSAIFVPQSINGLANGLMGTAWHGKDATHTATDYIRFSKSLDDGVTFSAMQKLVPGKNATLTASESGKLFITYEDAGVTKRIESTNNGDSWSTAITVGTGTNPSSLLDLTINFPVPLTIRKGASSVLFNGSWIVTTNSVPSGEIGQKTDKSNILTYSITTDGAMSTITEKINGVTVGTKTATNGQSLSVSLTQAQWDAIKYGKYATATGGLNTLTVEMGTDIWNYTFDKRLPDNADLLSAVKATQDAQNTFLPSIKNKLVGKIGGNASDSFETIINNTILMKKWASGTLTTNNTNGSFTLTGLSFRPTLVLVIDAAANTTSSYAFVFMENYVKYFLIGGNNTDVPLSGTYSGNDLTITKRGTGTFNLPNSLSITWMAFE